MAWNKLPDPKTWEQMKEHLRNKYQELKNVNTLSIQESILSTIDIGDQLKTQQEDLLFQAEKRFKSDLTDVMNLAILEMEKDKTTEKPIEHVNSTAEIMALKQEIKNLQAQLSNKNNPN